MKQNILSITKTAFKHFFDIDPVVTEVFIEQTAVQAQCIQQGVMHALEQNLKQGRARIIQLVHAEDHTWSAA